MLECGIIKLRPTGSSECVRQARGQREIKDDSRSQRFPHLMGREWGFIQLDDSMHNYTAECGSEESKKLQRSYG